MIVFLKNKAFLVDISQIASYSFSLDFAKQNKDASHLAWTSLPVNHTYSYLCIKFTDNGNLGHRDCGTSKEDTIHPKMTGQLDKKAAQLQANTPFML